MTQTVETRTFEAETQELLGLMIHSLYTQKDIFLRELISNASDALDKLRHAGLTDADLDVKVDDLAIRLEPDETARTLAVIDNGIGMSREEMRENLGTIARSGTRRFLEQLKEKKEDAPELIGQFGVGFYSAFMVADRVTVVSRKAGTTEATRWESAADGTYTLEAIDDAPVGTRITLHLKPAGDDESEQDFTKEWTLRSIVKRYSDFVEYPVTMEIEREEPILDEEGKPKGGETRKVTKVETLNSRTPLWSRARNEIEDEEYAEFYRHLTHDWEGPLSHLHFTAESPVEYTALLYLPKRKPMDLMDSPRDKSRLSLYVKRVLIMAECEDLLPAWLRFVRGVVDCPDLPLNVSRQTLQANPVAGKIRKHLISKVLKLLLEQLTKEREAYAGFYAAFGPVLKEGIYHGEDTDNRISKTCLFATTAGEERSTLAEYVERMSDEQEVIYYLTGLDEDTLRRSPHLESYRKKDLEVVLFTDPVDEWMLERFSEFQGKSLEPIHKGDAQLESDEERKVREDQETEHKDLLEAIQSQLEEHVETVRFTGRLTDSPAVLVTPEGGLGPAMERMMREMNEGHPRSRLILELNPEHSLVKGLVALHEREAEGEDLKDQVELLFGQALLRDGQTPPDPVRFSELITRLMATAQSQAGTA